MKLLTIPKAAERIGLSRQRVHLLVKKGRIVLDADSGLISIAEIARFKRLKREPGRPKLNGKPKRKK